MEHICHLPCRLRRVTLDGMCQRIHSGRCRQSLRHGGHHFRIYHSNDRHIMRIYAYKLSLSLNIRDNIVDRNLCSGTCGCRHSNDRHTRLPGRRNALQASDVLKFRICDDNADRFCRIHRRSAADCNDIVRSGFFERSHTGLHVLNRRICLDVGINLVGKPCLIQQIRYLCGYLKLNQIRV